MPEHYLSIAPYFGWDLVRDVQELLRYAFMQHAYEAGTIVALSAGIIGYFVVLRSLSFAAHALSHIGFAGATGAVLLGATPIVGLLAFTMSAGGGMGRMMRANVIATSGRAVEAAGDCDVLLLDKTGTITHGNRQASSLHAVSGVSPETVPCT